MTGYVIPAAAIAAIALAITAAWAIWCRQAPHPGSHTRRAVSARKRAEQPQPGRTARAAAVVRELPARCRAALAREPVTDADERWTRRLRPARVMPVAWPGHARAWLLVTQMRIAAARLPEAQPPPLADEPPTALITPATEMSDEEHERIRALWREASRRREPEILQPVAAAYADGGWLPATPEPLDEPDPAETTSGLPAWVDWCKTAPLREVIARHA